MNYPLISEYIEAIKASEENFEQLNYLRPVLDEDGEPVMTSGNFAVVFKMKDVQTGKLHAVKCFLKEQEGRAEAYRMIAEELEYVNSTFLTPIKYLDKELFVDTNASDDTEFPVLLMDWVEGMTLDKYIQKYVYNYQRAENLDETTESEEKAVELLVNGYELEKIAYQFSCLAIWLLQQPFAHGDLKPDNIIVKEDGRLVLVDYDGMYVPAMKGQKARELGSPDFRHPLRNEDDFDEHIDDFPLSSILLSLLAIANEPSLLEKYGGDGRLLLSERDYRNIAESEVLGALRPLMADKNLTTYLSLFYLCSAQKSLFKESYHLFTLPEPEKPSFMLEEVNLHTEVTEEDLANAWTDEYGVKYSADRKRLLKAPKGIEQYSIIGGTKIICDNAFIAEVFYNNNLKTVTIPPTVSSIGKYSFAYNKALCSIIIPDSVTSLGSEAFYGCHGLSSIKFSKRLTKIEDNTFSMCWSLKSLQLPDGLIEIGKNAFSECNFSEITIPATVVSIDNNSFHRCGLLTSITIPNNITKIGNGAFSGCYNLRNIVIEEENKKYDSRDDSNAIIESDSNTLLQGCSITIIPKTVSKIEAYAFSSLTLLTTLVIPENVTEVCSYAFEKCSKLAYITIENPSIILGSDIFSGCSNLTSIFVPAESKKYFEKILPDYKDLLVELQKEWKIKEIRRFNTEEIRSIERAEIVPASLEIEEATRGGFDIPMMIPTCVSQYRYSVCFHYGYQRGHSFIPLYNQSSLSLGDEIDINTAKLIVLECEGENDIYRVLE